MLLQIENLHVEISDSQNQKTLLKGIDLSLAQGEVHAVMGKNGSGKSTLANVLMGNPSYTVKQGKVLFEGEDLLSLDVFERARKGIFLAFQNPVSIPGVPVGQFLRASMQAVQGESFSAQEARKKIRQEAQLLGIGESFLRRPLNEGFSGGERKRMEILQMNLLSPRLIIMDEIDSGLDIDSLQAVAQSVLDQKKKTNCAVLLITHYQRILHHLVPSHVHVLIDGSIVRSGDETLAQTLEEKGYEWLSQS